MKTRKNNKGFSLVELIVVVAIMAVLVGVLAPAYLKYVEKSRVSKDLSAVGEVVQAIKVAAADEDINTELAGSASASYSIGQTAAALSDTNAPLLTAELATTIDSVGLTSNTVSAVTVAADITSGALEITVTATSTDTDVVADFAALGTN